ncbi:hypothetical protein FOZ62_012679, partial [Perkinsus olseni]
MTKDCRSREARKRRRRRYKERRSSRALGMDSSSDLRESDECCESVSSPASGASTTGPTDSNSWEALAQKVFDQERLASPMQDGSGLPITCQWDSPVRIPARFEAVVDEVADALHSTAVEWCDRPTVKEFLSAFELSSREQQSLMAEGWTKLGIVEAGNALSDEICHILERHGFGRAATFAEQASSVSKVKGRLLEALCRITADENIAEDNGIGFALMGGCGVGLNIPMLENVSTWPAFQRKAPKPGEPEYIRWQTDGSSLPTPAKLEGGGLSTLAENQIKTEVEAGRFRVMSARDAGSKGLKAVSKLNAIWKDSSRKRCRLISNYRTSGINRAVVMSTTLCLPTLQSLKTLVEHADRLGARKLGGYDIRSAFRSLSLREEEQGLLALVCPPGVVDGTIESPIIWERSLPFGLSSSPLQFTRCSGAMHRIQRRLLAVLANRAKEERPRGVLYLDDGTWYLFCILQLCMLLLLIIAVDLEVEFKKVYYLSRDIPDITREQQRRRQRVEEQRQQRQYDELKECTFTPRTAAASGGPSLRRSDFQSTSTMSSCSAIPVGPVLISGYDRFMENRRMAEEARCKDRQKKEASTMRTDSQPKDWVPTLTVPQPFQFSSSRRGSRRTPKEDGYSFRPATNESRRRDALRSALGEEEFSRFMAELDDDSSGLFAITIASLSTGACMAIALSHLYQHARRWVAPEFQVYIARIILLVPIYCLCAWASVLHPEKRYALALVRDAYEAYALYMFMVLNVNYLGELYCEPQLHRRGVARE